MTSLGIGMHVRHPSPAVLATTMIGCTIAFLLLSVPASGQEEPATLADLAWIAGSWSATNGRTTVEEHWTEAASNGMLGVGRTLSDQRMVAFEFLRIIMRDDGIFYIAQPNGRPPTEFKLTVWDETTATFENPDHDFPKRIVYTRLGEEAMRAWVDSGEGSDDARTFTYGRVRR